MNLIEAIKTKTGAMAVGAIATAILLGAYQHKWDESVMLGLGGGVALFGRQAIGKVIVILQQIIPLVPKLLALLENLDAQAASQEGNAGAPQAVPARFPSAPAAGTPTGTLADVYDAKGWTRYRWTGSAWEPVVDAGVSTSPPPQS